MAMLDKLAQEIFEAIYRGICRHSDSATAKLDSTDKSCEIHALRHHQWHQGPMVVAIIERHQLFDGQIGGTQ
jgi:hypothetical protein